MGVFVLSWKRYGARLVTEENACERDVGSRGSCARTCSDVYVVNNEILVSRRSTMATQNRNGSMIERSTKS